MMMYGEWKSKALTANVFVRQMTLLNQTRIVSTSIHKEADPSWSSWAFMCVSHHLLPSYSMAQSPYFGG